MQDRECRAVSDLSYNPSVNQGIWGNGLKVGNITQPSPMGQQVARGKDVGGHEWVTRLQRCRVLVWALSVCAVNGNKMELCRISRNCIMPSRENALAEDTTGIGGSLPHCHDFVRPYVSKQISRASSDSKTDVRQLASLKKITMILLGRREFPPWSGK